MDLLRQHQRYMIRYQTHENYLLLVDIPYREMDNARGMVIKWVFASGLILLLGGNALPCGWGIST